jgi:hypothetical protein
MAADEFAMCDELMNGAMPGRSGSRRGYTGADDGSPQARIEQV